MKTSGFSRIGIHDALLALAIFIVIPASAQVNFASQKSFSIENPGNGSATELSNFYADAKPYALHKNLLSFISSSGLLENGYDADIKNDLLNKDKENPVEPEISFRPRLFSYPVNSTRDMGIAEYATDQLILYARSLKQYAKKNGFDTSYAFLTNMGMLCTKKRFFIVNLNTMQVEDAGLVSHGRGQGPTIYDKQYSDEAGSRSTSLGRYKIMGKYHGGYGEAYKMMGLDSSNHNAYSRNIVLHSMNCIPDIENLFPACVSDGCPAVSLKFLSSLRKIIDSRKRPMLLWIFDSNLEEAVVEETHVNDDLSNAPDSPVYQAKYSHKKKQTDLTHVVFTSVKKNIKGLYTSMHSHTQTFFSQIKLTLRKKYQGERSKYNKLLSRFRMLYWRGIGYTCITHKDDVPRNKKIKHEQRISKRKIKVKKHAPAGRKLRARKNGLRKK